MKANFMRNSDSLFKLFSIVRIMPAVISTRHHGEIEGGYYGAFTQFVRFGDYTFTTQSFCRLVSRLAETPETQRESVRGYVDDRFQERYGDYMTSLFENMDDTDPISSIEDHIAETAGEAPIEDELDVFGESVSQEFVITNEGNADLVVSSIVVSDSLFVVSGISLPLTLSPGVSQNFIVSLPSFFGGKEKILD